MTDKNFLNLKNKIIVIAGATGLIGSELSKGFVEQGSTVIIASRNKDRAKRFEKKLIQLHKGKAVYCHLNIVEEKSVDCLIKFSLDKFHRIDVFINCSWPKPTDWMNNVEEVGYKSVKQNISDNLGGYFLCTQKMAI